MLFILFTALPANFDIRQCNETTYMCLSEQQCVPNADRCDNELQVGLLLLNVIVFYRHTVNG